MKADPKILIFDNEGEYTPESMELLLGGLAFGGKRDRPYDGQPWTAYGSRGRTLITGLTMRDIGDCIARGAALAAALAGLAEDSQGFDRPAVIQEVLIEIEKMMGIYPNVPEGPVRIPMLTMGVSSGSGSPEGAS